MKLQDTAMAIWDCRHVRSMTIRLVSHCVGADYSSIAEDLPIREAIVTEGNKNNDVTLHNIQPVLHRVGLVLQHLHWRTWIIM